MRSRATSILFFRRTIFALFDEVLIVVLWKSSPGLRCLGSADFIKVSVTFSFFGFRARLLNCSKTLKGTFVDWIHRSRSCSQLKSALKVLKKTYICVFTFSIFGCFHEEIRVFPRLHGCFVCFWCFGLLFWLWEVV